MAARLHGEAFTEQPRLTENLHSGDRYNAACTAALAGCGKGKDAGGLGEAERDRLRGQALTWLQADLAAWRKHLEKEPKARATVLRQMQHWQANADLAGVRGAQALARLPEAEQHRWQKLWQEVAALRKLAAEAK
jgi:hypothetical protein